MAERPHEDPDDAVDDVDVAADERPRIDVSGALGVAGHEEELLGTVGVADTGGVLHQPHEPDEREEAEDRLRSAVVTRGISPVD